MKSLRESIEDLIKEVADEEGYSGAIDITYWMENLCEEHGVTKEEIILMQDKINADRMSAKAKVIVDEGADLENGQMELLDQEFGKNGWELYPLNSKLTLEQQEKIIKKLQGSVKKQSKIVFATNSFPYLMCMLGKWSKWEYTYMFYKHISNRKEKSSLPWVIIRQNNLWSLIYLN